MKIGIGVTTYKREDLLAECISKISEYTKSDFTLYVATDTDEDRRGVAYRKNECLKNLKDCDYIFLFDDDCFPCKEGWETYIIQVSYLSKENHFVLQDAKNHKVKNVSFVYPHVLLNLENSGGVFMFITKECLKTIGGFYEGYNTYGFEHIGYSFRAYLSKVTSYPFVTIENLNEYIFSHDYQDESFQDEMSSVSKDDKVNFIEENKAVFEEEIKKMYYEI